MIVKLENSESREQLLSVAGKLFSERGYTAVTLKDIADVLKVKQAAIYYHVPEGKEQLYFEVMKRGFEAHREGITRVLSEVTPTLGSQLKALANWLLSQPPLDIIRLARTDLPALSPNYAQQLSELGDQALTQPIQQLVKEAYERGETRLVDTRIMATIIIVTIDTIHDIYRYKKLSKEVIAQDVIETLLDGMRRR